MKKGFTRKLFAFLLALVLVAGMLPSGITMVLAEDAGAVTEETLATVASTDVATVTQDGVTTSYSTLSEAFTYAGTLSEGTSNSEITIQLLAGTIEPESTDLNTYGYAAITLPNTLKNVTIKGADNYGTTIKNYQIGSGEDKNLDYEGITFEGIVFENSNIMIIGWYSGNTLKDWTFTDNIFKSIVRSDANNAAVDFNLSSPLMQASYADNSVENFTFTGNVIDSVTGKYNSGVLVSACKGTVAVTDNTISGVNWNALQFQCLTSDSTLTVTGNTFEQCGLLIGETDADGIINLNNCVGTININNNAIIALSESEYYLCYLSGDVDATNNFWGVASGDSAVAADSFRTTVVKDGETDTASGNVTVGSYTVTVDPWYTGAVAISTTPSTATVTVCDADGNEVSPDSDGYYWLLSSTTYTYTVSADGYVSETGTLADETLYDIVTVALDEGGEAIADTDDTGTALTVDSNISTGMLLTDSDKTEIAGGADISYILEVSDMDETEIDTTKQDAIEAVAEKIGDITGIYYLEINLNKYVTKNSVTDVSTVTQTGSLITITVSIPDELAKAAEGVEGAYTVIRYHDGEAEALETTDNGDGTLAFYMDRFSTYAIVYTATDKSVLQSVYDASLKLTESDYTSSTWAVLASAQQAAKTVLDDEDATQEEIDAALATLNSAIAALQAASSDTVSTTTSTQTSDTTSTTTSTTTAAKTGDTNPVLPLAGTCAAALALIAVLAAVRRRKNVSD